MTTASILLLEDDLLLGETLGDLLEDEGYTVHWCHNGQEALDVTFEESFDLYLLDINVPQVDGLTLLSELRSAADTTPTIFLTSHKEKEKRKKGFTVGADDYLTKPFDNDELLWRITALLRRSGRLNGLCNGRLCHDAEHHTVLFDGNALELTRKEYDLLTLLMRHCNKTVTKAMIEEVLWSAGQSGSEGAVRVYINRIKQLIGTEMIENIRGVGYRLVS
ncbi:MAG: response regulator transcription factor [Campylobacterales bacterium]|nr:response regulator transcription factor [Campylobacterales bacterium]